MTTYENGDATGSTTRRLAKKIADIPLKEFEFHGYTGKRRVISFGWHYDVGANGLHRTEAIPAFLSPLRDRVADTAFPPLIHRVTRSPSAL